MQYISVCTSKHGSILKAVSAYQYFYKLCSLAINAGSLFTCITSLLIPYSGKVWRVESLANHLQFAKLKPFKLVVTINNPLAELFIRQTFFRQMLKKSKFTKHSPRQTFLLYGNAYSELIYFVLKHANWPPTQLNN